MNKQKLFLALARVKEAVDLMIITGTMPPTINEDNEAMELIYELKIKKPLNNM